VEIPLEPPIRFVWKERRFPNVPGDEVEFAPLPDS
jgi:hypothetical protein